MRNNDTREVETNLRNVLRVEMITLFHVEFDSISFKGLFWGAMRYQDEHVIQEHPG